MSEEIKQILSRAAQSIEAAEVLLKKGLTGFSASRSYYAMFYTAEALLLSKGLSFSSHKAVISAFGKHFSKTKLLDSKFHSHLVEAYEKRQIGDYEFSEEITKEDAKNQIERAKDFLEAARILLKKTINNA